MEHKIKQEESKDGGKFYMEDDHGTVSELTYKNKSGQVMAIDHTETRENKQGQGLASKLLDFVVGYARKNELKIEPICPFVQQKFEETSAYQDIRA